MEPSIKSIHVVINPASGKPQPILHVLNKVCRPAGIDWDVSITKQAGDAERFARQASQSGVDVVVANGGDGTVMEVGRGLMGTGTPLAILPGGTANLLAVELGISKKLEEAAGLLVDAQAAPRWIDAGQVGDKIFLLRVGVGFSAARVKYADRSMKDRFGMAAYSLSAVKSSIKTVASDFRMTLDGQILEIKAMTCLIDNAGNMGQRFARAASGIDISDGLLDVLVIHSAFEELKSGVPGKRSETGLNMVTDHWQAAHIEIEATPPQPVQVDGEMVNDTPITIQVLPKALRVLAPALSGST